MKNKLTELLNKGGRCDKYVPGGCAACEYDCDEDKCEEYLTNLMADDLIRAGVVVLPVKPNDTVYTISRGKIKEWLVYFIGMNSLGEFTFNIADKDFQNSRSVWNREIGDTIFLTEEDAITELKERKGREKK
jgi:hypothetical protein